MYCEILQHRHAERKLESVVTRETHRHTSLFYNYLAVREIKECNRKCFGYFGLLSYIERDEF